MPDLPPLQAVRAFEAVARHGNFTRAAVELNMTQSAVSYQIKLLESFIGAPLFVREARGVRLNERGLSLAPLVARSLADLGQGFRAASEHAGTVLTISTMQTLAGNWLAPRIGGFQMLHPEYAVRLDISNRVVDFASDDIDVAIRSGRGQWPGVESHLLIEQCFTAVASPLYLAREGQPASAAEMMARHVLIAPSDDWWPIWFRAAGVAGPIRIARPGVDVDTQQMAASVATTGHGIAVATPGFIADDLKAGRLVPLFDVTATSGLNYYLAYAADRRNQRKIRLFRDWVLNEAGRA
jgi:LysR family transcriptional regulator, glycine cleavage system transcriptional activator